MFPIDGLNLLYILLIYYINAKLSTESRVIIFFPIKCFYNYTYEEKSNIYSNNILIGLTTPATTEAMTTPGGTPDPTASTVTTTKGTCLSKGLLH